MVKSSVTELIATLHAANITLWVEHGQLRSKAPAGAITPFLRTQIQGLKEELIAFVAQAQAPAQQTVPQPVARPEQIPLSFAQQRLWFVDQMGSGAAYHIFVALQLTGHLDVTALRDTLNEVIARHESLRTTFGESEAGVAQVIHPASPLPLLRHDWRHLSPNAQTAALTQQAQQAASQPFALSQDWPLRAQLVQVTADRHVLLLTLHHIAGDGWSLGVLLRELTALYAAFTQGQPSPLPPLPLQYADFALWQRAYLQGERLAEQLTYWKTNLAGAPPLLQLPQAAQRPALQTFDGQRVPCRITPTLTQALRQVSHQAGATLFMTLLAAFQTLLYRYTGQTDIVVGAPIANRHRQELEGLIGFFVNTLVLRTNLADNPTFLALLAQVRQTTEAAYDHQDLPFERLVEELQPERTLAYNPLVQIVFALQNAPMTDLLLPGLQVGRLPLRADTVRMDLEVHLWERDGGLDGFWVFNPDLYDAATIERMVGHFTVLLAGIIANPATPVSHLPLLTPTERQQLLVAWNDTQVDYPTDQCIHQLFEAQVERTPDAVALVCGEQQLTYQELDQRANQLAHYLRTVGVGPEVLVGLCLERSLELIVGMLAIFKAGGAYLPLDPHYPAERLAFMLADAKPTVILTQGALVTSLPNPTAHVLCLTQSTAILANQPRQAPLNLVQPHQLAYVIYTSGSTGRPKGVLLEHGGLSNLAHAQIRALALQPGHRVLQVASLNFDASISEIVMALGSGATLVLAAAAAVLPGAALTHTLQHAAITHVTLVPTALAWLDPHMLPHFQTVIVAGEACPPTLAARWVQARQLFNAYGPTESTVCATMLDCRHWSEHHQPPPIGRPIANTQVYVLDEQRQPVPIGVAGELYVGGVGVARGYLHRPELTAERFLVNPFGAGRLYKTGDLVRWRADGTLDFLGRLDQQVKLRGFRIELGEIESALLAQPGVQEAVVAVYEFSQAAGGSDKRLVAYLIGAIDVDTLRQQLGQRLPEYMMPAAFVLLDAMPLTPNGKIDRKALPAPNWATTAHTAAFVPPSTPTEEVITQIWGEVLGLPQISIHDNFFQIGGHSLLATQVIARVHQRFPVDLPLRSLFEQPTVAGLAEQIDERLYAKLAQLSEEEALDLVAQMNTVYA